MNSWYTIRAQSTGAEVVIYDEIGAYGVSAKGFLAELGALPDATPLALRLNSPGGSVFDAVAIYNAIKRHSGTVTVWIDGIAASAASYIAMAGDEIVMPENAFLMIHDPAGMVMGTAIDMRAMAEALDKIKGSLLQRLCRQSGRSAGRNRRPDGGRNLARCQGCAGSRALPTASSSRSASPRASTSGGSAMRRLCWWRVRSRLDGLGRLRKQMLVEPAETGVRRRRRRRSPGSRRPLSEIGPLPNPIRPPIPAAACRHQMPPVPIPTVDPCAPMPSPTPAPSSISAASPGSRRWRAASSNETPSLDEVRAASWPPGRGRTRHLAPSPATRPPLWRAPLGRRHRPHLQAERIDPCHAHRRPARGRLPRLGSLPRLHPRDRHPCLGQRCSPAPCWARSPPPANTPPTIPPPSNGTQTAAAILWGSGCQRRRCECRRA
jgi:ATP-dependent protease ClpP protease subunit